METRSAHIKVKPLNFCLCVKYPARMKYVL